jgi:hypothetical protein
MKKTLIALLAAVTVAGAVASSATEADARNHRSNSGAVAAGVIGGIALGAIIGSTARPAYGYPAYGPAPGYVVYQSYRSPHPVACPGGYWARRVVAHARRGRPVAWSQPRFICPSYY